YDLHVISDRYRRAAVAGRPQHVADVGRPGHLGGVEAVPPLHRQGVLPQQLVAGGAPYLGCGVVVLGQELPGLQRRQHGAAAGDDPGAVGELAFGDRLVAVQPPEDPVLGPVGHGRHRYRLVVEGDVVKAILRLLAIHPVDPVLDDDGQFVGEGGVVDLAVGHGGG